MKSVEVRVDVTAAVGTGDSLHCAATVFLPDGPPPTGGDIVVFGYPGGGYNRRYYNLEIAGHDGYSQAEHHTQRGFVFVGCDHLGVGDSDIPAQTLDFVAVGTANSAVAAEVLARLTNGTLDPGVGPRPVRAAVGIGQSFGGFTLTLSQAHAPIFDGVAMLGWSGLATVPPWPPNMDLMALFTLEAGNGLNHPMRPWFHLPDVPDDIVAADMTKLPGGAGSAAAWSTAHSPGGPSLVDHRNPVGRAVLAPEAGSITVPVMVVAGATDVIGDAWHEPYAYRSSPDVTVCVLEGMAHMHNFATTRERLWNRLAHWYTAVADMKE